MKSQHSIYETSPTEDLKEVSKRIIHFLNIVLVVCTLMIPVRLFFGHYVPAATSSTLCIFCGIILWLSKTKNARFISMVTIIVINAFLVFSVLSDGLNMGGYLYYFPLFFALPFIIEKDKKYTKEVSLYFCLTVVSIAACFIFGGASSAWQSITNEAYKTIYIINVVCAVVLSAGFAFYSIYFERKYAKAIVDEKNKTEEALKSRSQFLSHMGHELRTPLNGIIGATNLLIKLKTEPEQEEYVNILKYCSNHMLDLINNILDYNKIEAEKLEIHLTDINLKQLLHNSLLPFHNRFEEKKIDLKLDIDNRLNDNILIDDIRFTQILNNLISNALKFTEKGYVRLSASLLNSTDEQMEVTFSVEDTGIGIKKEDYKKIFESFEQVYSESTRKYQGTGLGLSISQRIIRLMDSELKVDSEPGVGSKFYFTVSFKKGGRHPLQKAITKMDGDLKGLRILIAEDNMINMLIATKMLEDWKVNFTTAENGRQALESLKRDANYDLILMDLEMPEMDGYTAVKEITKLYPDVPVLAFTANLVDHQMFNSLKQLGFVDAMLKPFQPMELFSKIRYYAN